MSGTFRRGKLGAAALVLTVCLASAVGAQTGYFGTAKVNINPQTPITLSGYAGRSNTPEASGVQQSIFAQAAAFGAGSETALLFTVDCTGVPDNVIDPLKAHLSTQLSIDPARIAVTCTHSHNCPHVAGYASNLFNPPLTPTRQAHVDQYTASLSGWLGQVASQALANRTPGHTYSWGNGTVSFATNRRGETPVDHDLPVLAVRDASGQLQTIITSYATHAVALPAFDGNMVSMVGGDWPGYARERIEALFPGVNAMVMIGAGADSNPSGPLASVATAQSHGQSVANEVQRLVTQQLLAPVSQQIAAYHTELVLDYATARLPGDPSDARLASSPSSASYGISSWTFGDDLAMVFMEGEVVADYSLRIKSELGDKVWVNAYSNDVQGYIPSERILYAGGYEADVASFYYGVPGRFAHGLEDKIVGAVHDHLLDFSGLADRLRLVIDWSSGEVSIANLGDEAVTIDGYTIAAPAGNLNPANGAWHSLQDQGAPGWDQADNSTNFRLTEFNPAGTKAFAVGNSVTLGRPLSLTPPASFGDEIEGVDLEFEYSVPGEGTVQGLIAGAFSEAPINNLVLTVDPETGAAAIQNASPFFDVSITAYTIASADGALQAANGDWSSLQDQGLAGWDEADNADAFRLTEFKTWGSTLLPGGETVLYLGAPFDIFASEPELANLDFEFLLSTGVVMEGVIVLGDLPVGDHAGDFDADGDVDGGDFLVWQRTLGTAANPIGSGADGNANGVIEGGDLAIWKMGYRGSTSSANSAGVPEPASLALSLALVAGAVIACTTSRIHRRSFQSPDARGRSAASIAR